MILLPKQAYSSLRTGHGLKMPHDSRMEEFLCEARRLFEAHLTVPNLLLMSGKLRDQIRPKLQSGNICMLPSYIHTLTSGQEKGTYLALDVGGSTLRVAAVQLFGRKNGHEQSMEIIKMRSFRIDNMVKALKGSKFFDWMAERIAEVLEDPIVKRVHGSGVFAMGLAWSFPVEYVALLLLHRSI